MTWVTLLRLSVLSARLNKLANSWTAEPPFVQAGAQPPRSLAPGEGRRQGLRMSRDCSRSHSGQIARVKQPDQLLLEINFVDTIGHCFESHRLPNKGSADKALAAVPFDVAAIAHPPALPPTGIFHRRQLHRHQPIARPVNLCRNALAQCFVRTHLIVAPDPGAEASFLRRDAGRGRLGDIGAQDPMHLFVRTVVFGVSWPDKLHHDPQAQPPHTQAREAQSAFATKGRTIVHPNDFGQAITTKNLHHRTAHCRIALIGQEHHRQYITTEQIAHRQRFASLSIACAKPALEVDCPHFVAGFGRVYSPPHQDRSAPRPSLALPHQTQLHQPTPQRAHRRDAPRSRKSLLQPPPQLFCSPTRMRSAHFVQPMPPHQTLLFPSRMRPTRTIGQRLYSSGPVALPPLVTALATDPKPRTHRRKRLALAFDRKHKSHPRLRHQKLFPRHRCPRKCHLCHETELLPMS